MPEADWGSKIKIIAWSATRPSMQEFNNDESKTLQHPVQTCIVGWPSRAVKQIAAAKIYDFIKNYTGKRHRGCKNLWIHQDHAGKRHYRDRDCINIWTHKKSRGETSLSLFVVQLGIQVNSQDCKCMHGEMRMMQFTLWGCKIIHKIASTAWWILYYGWCNSYFGDASQFTKVQVHAWGIIRNKSGSIQIQLWKELKQLQLRGRSNHCQEKW